MLLRTTHHQIRATKPLAYLTDEARKKAWPILGPDPKNLPWWAKQDDKLFDDRPKAREKKKPSQ